MNAQRSSTLARIAVNRRTFGMALATFASLGLTSIAPADTLASGDFDGDGRADLAIGVPGEDMQTIANAGGIHIIYGSGSGLTILADEWRHQDKPGVEDQCEANDLFGYALAAGDFNNDGFDDLAVGVPYEEVGDVVDAGAIAVFYGGPNGVLDQADQFWHQNSPGMVDSAQNTDHFGKALAAGDFDNDGFDDLAIGVPREDILADSEGAVHVMYGGGAGLSAAGDQLWHQDSPGIADNLSVGDQFGKALAAGDFNNDGFDDLAIGVPLEEVANEVGAGVVHVLRGSANGITAVGDQYWDQNTPGMATDGLLNDNFGHALAVGDFNNDGFDDLAIGVPNELIDGVAGAGAVELLHGSVSGLSVAGYDFWHKDRPGIIGDPGVNAHFGYALAAADFDGDGFDDLAVGIPHQNIDLEATAGAVHILYGTPNKLQAAGNQPWDQDSPGIKNAVEADDELGKFLAAGDFNNDGRADLAISVHGEDLAGVSNCGAVAVLYGKSAGLDSAGNQLWHQNIPDAHDSNEPNDNYSGVPLGF